MTTNDTEADRLAWFQEACEEADYRWHLFSNAKTTLDQADALVALRDAMFAVRTYLPGYDYETSTLPWEREQA